MTRELSYWEYKSWLTNIDFTIVGSGITGLSCALQLRKLYPKSKILILERGSLPQGASTKNAGFACFGSLSELISDLNTHSEDELLNLVQMRVKGLALLRQSFGDAAIGYKNNGGYELFFEEQDKLYANCLEKLKTINNFLQPVFKESIFSEISNSFNFQKIKPRVILNKAEGQLDTGKMMYSLLKKVRDQDINILNNWTVDKYNDTESAVVINANGICFNSNKLLIATNGFASQLGINQVIPARNQVLVTKPIKDLKIKGTFHLDEGYVYFRNIDDRILLGGGRNLNLKGEQTDLLGTTQQIQNYLERLLSETILPNTPFEIEHRWSGILGVGDQKKPIVKQLSNNVFCGVRMGGMGVAIGSLVGKELAELLA
ncbi:NAD(P)/FAD-dependent oxidoreductase [Leeuwenhoekiella sp. MAR_2009_132]|uniref:NAD(P)/FAD-dependent oxidoreductase n=1 Tax=Leeuwenhoekiella sp. MAR_2009_132 TaxID=1392489 RepID=UPI00055C67DB|nr:FAD-dependent oxidoreductase [Leeuwenhoekiella sp. MAR_2009_132]